MLKKVITYTNPFTDAQVTEEHYFHISKADMVEMEMEVHNATYHANDGRELTGMQAKLQRIIDAEDGKAIIAELKDIIRRSYGRKDGDRFLKSEQIWQEFAASEAFSQLLFELCTDADKAAEFTNGIIPNNLAQEAAAIAQQSANISDREETEKAAVTELEQIRSERAAEITNKVEASSQGGSVVTEPRLLSDAELREMDPGELRSGLAEGRYKLS